MVSALKSYNNSSRAYRRLNANKNVLDMLISRFSKESTAKYPPRKKSFVDESVQNLADNSIIEGYFPKENVVREMAIKRVNKLLCIVLGLLLSLVVISYYFVITCEIKLNDLSRQTVVLNNENEELQNRLDSLKSFSNVDKTFQANNMLKRAGQVIETSEVVAEQEEIEKANKPRQKRLFNYAIGF